MVCNMHVLFMVRDNKNRDETLIFSVLILARLGIDIFCYADAVLYQNVSFLIIFVEFILLDYFTRKLVSITADSSFVVSFLHLLVLLFDITCLLKTVLN